ncbi:MAG: hypothetical protein J6B54_07355 [Clostridia bacterium]|nr:hypothetical protein [Clostridia bacterium]
MKKLLSFFRGDNDSPLTLQYRGLVRYVPLLLSGGFFALTIFLYAFGPLDWHVINPEKLYPFLLLCLVALIGGYVLATVKGRAVRCKRSFNVGWILLVGGIIFLVLFFPLTKITTGKWFPDVYRGITNTGYAYQVTKYFSATAPKLFFYIRIILSPFIYMVTPLTLLYWRRLPLAGKILGTSVIVLNISLGIAQGVNKHVADIVIQLVLVLCLFLFAKHDGTRKEKWMYRGKILVGILLICITFLLYYGNVMRNRVSMDIAVGDGSINIEEAIDPEDEIRPEVDKDKVNDLIGDYATFSVSTERENSLWDVILPQKIKPTVTFLTSYFCHGYTGLSLAMEREFTSSYGLGFSDFLRHNVSKLFGGQEFEDKMYENTYMYKIAQSNDWVTGKVWSSFFIFPASDVSFPGTILVVFLIGFLFGLSWKDTLQSGNPFAAATFIGFITMVFFFSANNQMFQSGESFTAFVGVIAAWLLTRWFFGEKRAK